MPSQELNGNPVFRQYTCKPSRNMSTTTAGGSVKLEAISTWQSVIPVPEAPITNINLPGNILAAADAESWVAVVINNTALLHSRDQKVFSLDGKCSSPF
jgi:hypothetical protein